MKKQIQEFIEKNIGVKSPREWTKKSYTVDTAMQKSFEAMIADSDVVIIMTDYDCDGICSAYNLDKGIKACHPNKSVLTVFPDRMKDGYGVATRNLEAVARVIKRSGAKNPCIITCDTGIAEKEKFAYLKDYAREIGCTDFKVIVTDHHNIPDELPDVDLICNPHLKGFTYENYCGAGVVYKLVSNMLKTSTLPEDKKKSLLEELTIFTGIATVADQVEMKEDNWCITRRSLVLLKKKLRDNTLPNNLQILLRKMEIYHPAQVDEGLYGFTIGPLFNASGRMKGTGAKEVFNYLLHPDFDLADGLIFQNKLRKEITNELMETLLPSVDTEQTPLWVYVPNSYEGLCGLLAGKLAEALKVPVLVLTDGLEEGLLKGSGRTYGTFNIYAYLKEVQSVLGAFQKFGGHNDACGLSIKKEDYLKMTTENANVLHRELEAYDAKETYFSGLDICELVEIQDELEKEYAPFGQGNERPTFAFEVNRNAMEFKTMGEASNHFYTMQDGYRLIHFYHDQNTLENEDRFYLLGNITPNVYKNQVSQQFIARDVADIGTIRCIDCKDLEPDMDLEP